VIKHTNRTADAASIAQLAVQNDVGLIIVGQSMNMDGTPSPSGRKAARLEEAIQMRCSIPTQLWDESFSTNDAQEIGLMLGKPKHQRRGHQDELAAAVILQSYLDAH
jgi:putative Holliday junction resolvase